MASAAASIFIEGLFAGIMYQALRIMHEQALNGSASAFLRLITRALVRRTGAQVKLHEVRIPGHYARMRAGGEIRSASVTSVTQRRMRVTLQPYHLL